MIVLLGLGVLTCMSVVMVSGSPSSTSAHSAGLERDGGGCS